MKKIVFITGLVLLFTSTRAQVIPATRRVNWQQIVRQKVFTEPANKVNVLDFGAMADGETDNTEAVRAAVASFHGRAGTVIFPEGTYLFRSPVTLPDSIRLEGEGASQTTLRFDLGTHPESCLQITGHAQKSFVRLDSGFTKGSAKVLTDSAFVFEPGEWVEMVEDNGSWNTVPVEWAKMSVGQIVRIEKVAGDTLVLEQPLRISYTDSLRPRLRRIFPVRHVSVACLKIVRSRPPDAGGGYNISWDYAVDGRVSGVESDSSSGSHIYISRSAGIVVEGSYFHHAFFYDGSSTHGYGVTLAHHSSGCLVVNNIFVHLRHALMVKTGANGNVLAYNYSRDPFRSETISDLSGDISLHGHYPYANLFEGNIVQNIIIDHYWGPSGPLNTFFRNRAELWGIIMTRSDTTETARQNFVGNECTDNSFYHGQFVLYGKDHFVYANNILGMLVPASSGDLPDRSYYLSHAPAFWDDADRWPDIGWPFSLGEGDIPARKRFYAGGDFTVCPEASTAVENRLGRYKNWHIGPNPVRNVLHVVAPTNGMPGFSLRFFSLDGRLLLVRNFSGSHAKCTVRKELPPGIYLLEVLWRNGRMVKKMVVL